MKDLIWHQMRADALKLPCEYCGKPIGKRCVNPRTGDEIRQQAAHNKRLLAAGYGSMVLA